MFLTSGTLEALGRDGVAGTGDVGGSARGVYPTGGGGGGGGGGNPDAAPINYCVKENIIRDKDALAAVTYPRMAVAVG